MNKFAIMKGNFEVDFTLNPTAPAWRHKSKRQLLNAVWGRPRHWIGRIYRVASLLACYIPYNPIVTARWKRLKKHGFIDRVPTWSQSLVAGKQQIMGPISAETIDYYEKVQGIDFDFHVKRRLISDPSTNLDPVGIYGEAQTLINHIMQTIHMDPRHYDMALMYAYKGGPKKLKKNIMQLIAGVHPEQKVYDNLIEDPTYPYRLGFQVEQFLANPHEELAPPSFSLDESSEGKIAIHQCSTLRGFARYACRLDVGVKDVASAFYDIGKKVVTKIYYAKKYGKKAGYEKWRAKNSRVEVNPYLCDKDLQERYGFS